MESDFFEDSITALAFKLHHEGGQAHMFGKTNTYNPMLIFPDTCSCMNKARAKYEEIKKAEDAKRALQFLRDQEQFTNLFEPRIA